MLRATSSTLLRAAVLLAFVLTQLLVPLLHGHFGAPNQTGLHVHADLPVAVDLHFHSALSSDGNTVADGRANRVPHDANVTNGDAFEVDVETGMMPLLLAALLQLTALACLFALTFVLLAALASCVTRRPTRSPGPVPARWRYGISRPPPAHAPPLSS